MKNSGGILPGDTLKKNEVPVPVSGKVRSDQMGTRSGSCPAGSPAAPALGASENGFYVDFYEAAGRVKSVLSSVLFVPAVCG